MPHTRSREHLLALKMIDEISDEHRENLAMIESVYEAKGVDPDIISLVVAVSGFNRDLMLDFAARYAEALRGDTGIS